MKLRFFIIIATILCIPAAVSAFETQEISRIRVENSAGGSVKVSLDKGATYTCIGRVSRPATMAIKGFPASAYLPDGVVAATAIHGIRLKTGTDKYGQPMMVSLVPAEFSNTPKGYGGHIPRKSGVYTNIPAGCGIFRNLAPFVGNPIRLERNRQLVSLPKRWQPKGGEVIVIIVRIPKPYLRELEIENKVGGQVVTRYDDGREARIATVTQPVKGIGRFDGTSYTGVGLINTNHAGVVTISSAPISTLSLFEGEGPERRGGFEIQPSAHAKTQPPMTQALIIAPAPGVKPLEGSAPIFFGYIGLAYDPLNPNDSLRVEVSISDGEWQPMPEMMGRDDQAVTRQNITKFRLIFPKYDQEFLKRALANAVN
ncbi:MAG: hypothetical protein ABFD46_05470 [Armatimonadota bacterium]